MSAPNKTAKGGRTVYASVYIISLMYDLILKSRPHRVALSAACSFMELWLHAWIDDGTAVGEFQGPVTQVTP